MRMNADITDVNPNEILHYMANDLILWGAGIMTRDPDVKVVVNDRDEWEHGDNVTW